MIINLKKITIGLLAMFKKEMKTEEHIKTGYQIVNKQKCALTQHRKPYKVQ